MPQLLRFSMLETFPHLHRIISIMKTTILRSALPSIWFPVISIYTLCLFAHRNLCNVAVVVKCRCCWGCPFCACVSINLVYLEHSTSCIKRQTMGMIFVGTFKYPDQIVIHTCCCMVSEPLVILENNIKHYIDVVS